MGSHWHKRPKAFGSEAMLNRYHLVDTSSIALRFPDAERAIAMEAQQRGASTLELSTLLMRTRKNALEDSTGSRLRLINDSFSLPMLDFEPWLYIEEFDRLMRHEFSNLPATVRSGFQSTQERAERRIPLAHYKQIRAAYYQRGYSDPAKHIFQHIRDASLLGHSVSGGLHEECSKKLEHLAAKLDDVRPGLSREVAGMLAHGKRSIALGGFVPRFIAPRQGGKTHLPVLSNHAFGLAIDVNSSTNPHIKDRDVIDILKAVTGYDFGHSLDPECALDHIEQIYRKQQAASDSLSQWLRRYLPIYRSLVPGKKSSKRPSARSGPISEPELATDEDNACSVETNDEVTDATVKIRILLNYHTMDELETWSRHGIQSLPLEFVIAMTSLGFRWGGEYEGTKDVMHFELLHETVIPPDSKPRPLKALFHQGDTALRLRSI